MALSETLQSFQEIYTTPIQILFWVDSGKAMYPSHTVYLSATNTFIFYQNITKIMAKEVRMKRKMVCPPPYLPFLLPLHLPFHSSFYSLISQTFIRNL